MTRALTPSPLPLRRRGAINRHPSKQRARRLLAGAACLACLLLQGCGRTNQEPPPDILKAQREALDKAKATEKTVQEAVERRDAQMEAQQK